MNVLLSIIIPVYNSESYLRDCLESVRKQHFRDFECVLVDDGSTDSSKTICDEYAKRDKRFRIFHIENGGVSNARNFGIEHSSGDFVTFVDSDDYINEETYEKVMRRLHVDKSDVCCYGIRRVSNDHSIKKIAFKDKGIIQNFINHDVYMHSVCNKVFRRDLITNNSILFSKDLIVCEDMLFSFEALVLSKNVSYLDKYYYSYRIKDQLVCQKGFSKMKIQNYKKVVEYLREFCRKNGIIDEFIYFINYRQMYYAIQFLINPIFYSPIKFRESRGKRNIWIYTFRLDLFIMTVCSSLYFDLPSRLFIELKKKKLRMK